ncbi:bestrophin-like domain [Acrocarpospora catenulata]|uniref:bestrophin-like domain n=1 Tax=Acrocarpospora catenulata TaxID=2836182 RepID=UPI001BD9E81A|nr:DUF4239 domain-containing protein [Acrocarpospora catenulata]
MGWVVVFAVLVFGLAALVFSRLWRYGRPDEDGGAGTIDLAVHIALAVFLVVLAYAVVLCRDAISAADADVGAEAESLTELYWAAAPLPGSGHVRSLVRSYTSQSIKLDWPLMAADRTLSPEVDRALLDLRAAVTRLASASPVEEDLRTEALARAAEVSHARALRMDDATTELEPVFFTAMVISGLLVIVLPWTLRRRPSMPSIVADVVRIVTVVAGIVLVTEIAHPYGVRGAVEPTALEAAQAQYDHIDKAFPVS